MTTPLAPLPPVLPSALQASHARLTAPTAETAVVSARRVGAGLNFSGWNSAPATAAVRGDLSYPGNAADAGAVAEAIVSLLFDRG